MTGIDRLKRIRSVGFVNGFIRFQKRRQIKVKTTLINMLLPVEMDNGLATNKTLRVTEVYR